MAKNSSGGTDRIHHFDLPREIKQVNSRFRYRYFVPEEQVDQLNSNRENWDFGEPPRYVKLTWTGENDIVVLPLLSPQGPVKLVHRKNLFFPSDLNSRYSIISSKEEKNQEMMNEFTSDVSEGSKLDYLLKESISSNITTALENSFENESAVQIPVLDETTRTPIVVSRSILDGAPPDIAIRNTSIGSIMKYSDRSPLYPQKQWSSLQETSKIIQKKSKTKLENSEYKRVLSTLNKTIESLKKPAASLLCVPPNGELYRLLETWILCGYIISKYLLTVSQNGELTETYMYSRFVTIREFFDPYVAYGKKYKYCIRPIYAKRKGETNEIILLGSDESVEIEQKCIEKRVPSPPTNIKFEYIGNNEIVVSWSRPQSRLDDGKTSWDSNDIKGYQIFLRNTLIEPYHLYKYFTFNNTFPANLKIRAHENIGDDFIISSERDIPNSTPFSEIPEFYEFKKEVLTIRPNQDYYLAMCSIDAHGNSSNYSAQYRIRRNNVTGEVEIRMLCAQGAPKQLPNLLIPGKLVNPAFKASGYRYMDVYFNPDTKLSVPNLEEASVNLQMFELETQVEKNIIITIKEPSNN